MTRLSLSSLSEYTLNFFGDHMNPYRPESVHFFCACELSSLVIHSDVEEVFGGLRY